MKDLENRPHLQDFLEPATSPDDTILNSFVTSLEKSIFTLQKIKCTPEKGEEHLPFFNKAIDSLTQLLIQLEELDRENQYVHFKR